MVIVVSVVVMTGCPCRHRSIPFGHCSAVISSYPPHTPDSRSTHGPVAPVAQIVASHIDGVLEVVTVVVTVEVSVVIAEVVLVVVPVDDAEDVTEVVVDTVVVLVVLVVDVTQRVKSTGQVPPIKVALHSPGTASLSHSPSVPK